jgi:chaperonin cofactor prefoldin
LYKKAILQNLEFIADSEATKKIFDKKAYQFTLLKITTHENCVAITNHFYQSLIKKRIVMLNKNQSKKSKSWKYAMIMPFLFAFMFYYQVKAVAQEKKGALKEKNAAYAEESAIYIYKNSTEAEMKIAASMLQKNNSVFIKFSKIKRNSKGEITAIRIDYKDKVGKKGTSIIDGDEPIDNLTIFRTKNSIEISSNDKKNEVYETAIANEEVTALVEFTDPVSEKTANIEINDNDFPTPPTPPTPPTFNFNAPKAPNFPKAPKAPKGDPIKGDKKAWKEFEKKMEDYEAKMKKLEPQMEAFDKQMGEFDKKMEPFNKEMEAFEKKMKVYEQQMEEYHSNLERERKK